jgi:AraC-like DNA-binding protein
MTEAATLDSLSPVASEAVGKAHAFVEQEAERGNSPTLVEVARAAGLSRFHLHRCFTAFYGYSPKQLATWLRIGRAKKLMLEGLPLIEVAARCGFAHQGHFTASFKSEVGQTPGRWRKQNWGQAAS